MTRTLITSVVFVALILSGVLLVAMIPSTGSLDPQPIAFNHKLHLERVQGIQCANCHQFVTSQPYAGIPGKEVCFGCHDPEADKEDPEADAWQPRFAKLMEFAHAEGDIPWHRVTTTRDDVFFSHRRHVKAGQLDCRTCHPVIPTRTEPLERGPIILRMATCLACHEQSGASTDCIACHR